MNSFVKKTPLVFLLLVSFITSCRQGVSHLSTQSGNKNFSTRQVDAEKGAISAILGRSAADADKPQDHLPIFEPNPTVKNIPMAMNMLNLSTSEGVVPVPVDTIFLLQRFENLFGKTPRKDNMASFSIEQKSRIGETVLSNRYGIGFKFGMRQDISPDAFQVLREFLGDACAKKLDSEIAMPKADNFFIKAKDELPSEDTINTLMIHFFGYSAPQSKTHKGAAEYSKAVKETVDAAPTEQKEEALKNGLLLTCMHIGLDARTLLK